MYKCTSCEVFFFVQAVPFFPLLPLGILSNDDHILLRCNGKKSAYKSKGLKSGNHGPVTSLNTSKLPTVKKCTIEYI